MIRNLVSILLLGLLAAAVASAPIGKEQIEEWMWRRVGEGGEVPLTAALVMMGVGIGPALPSCNPP